MRIKHVIGNAWVTMHVSEPHLATDTCTSWISQSSHSSIVAAIEDVCVCSNANPLHYYALRAPCKVDKWRRLGRPHYVWDEYLYSVLYLKLMLGRLYV